MELLNDAMAIFIALSKVSKEKQEAALSEAEKLLNDKNNPFIIAMRGWLNAI